LVVIAIIGLLSAIALPAYNIYSSRAITAGILKGVQDSLRPQIAQYYSRTGTFPTATNLGLAISGTVVTSPAAFNPNISEIIIDSGFGEATPSQCVGVEVSIPGSNVGATFNSSGANTLIFTFMMYVDSTGTMQTVCGTYQNQLSDYNYLPANCVYGYITAGPGGKFNIATNNICY